MNSILHPRSQQELRALHAEREAAPAPAQGIALIAEAFEQLGACDDRAAILETLRLFARRLVGADGVSIVLRDGEKCFYARTDAVEGALWEGQRFPLASCISGWVMLKKETAVIPDVFQDVRIPHDVYRSTFVRSLIMVPVGREDALAAIGAYWASVRMPGDDEVAMLESLARAAGTALQRCAAEERLRASERRLRLAFASTLVGFCFASADGHILEMNERFEAICGYPAAELVGRHFLCLTHPDDREANSRLIADLLDGRVKSFHLDKRYLHRKGHVVWVRNDVWLVEDPAGGAPRIAAAVVDVTNEREAQERLLQAQKLDLLGQLTGGIAHDFNNLLTVINGSAECLADELSDRPALLELARVVHRTGLRGAELIRSLLAFARRQPLEPRLIAPDDMARAMLPLLKRTLGSDITLDLRSRSAEAGIRVDPAQFEAALMNLCVNARNAMPSGGRLTISIAPVLLDEHGVPVPVGGRGRPHIAVAVADEGTGMPEEVRLRAFEPFFTTRQDRGGSGLGLSMVYGFARQAGGYATIDSAPDKGCTVTMYLPCADRPVHRDDSVAEPGLPGRGERVLLVEDDPGVRSYVSRALCALGFDVEVLADPLAALALLDGGARCDLLLTDVVMPGSMDGIALGQRATAVRPGLPVVYMTGYADRFAEDFARAGAPQCFLHKPFRREELGRTVRALLDRGLGA